MVFLFFRPSLSFFFWSPTPLPFISSPFISHTMSPACREEERDDSPEKSKGQGRRVKGPWLQTRESVRWWLCAASNQLIEKVVHPRISSMASMCIPEAIRWGVCALPTSSMTSQCLNASVRLRVWGSANQFPNEVVWCRESIRWLVCVIESICWGVYASPINSLTRVCSAH